MRDPGALLDVRLRALEYDPTDPWCLQNLLPALKRLPTNDVYRSLSRYQGPPVPELLVFLAEYATTRCARLHYALQCLSLFPTASFHVVRSAVDYARQSLDAANTNDVHKYYLTVLTAALHLPNDEASVPTTAYLLQELCRLEVLFPALTSYYGAHWMPPCAPAAEEPAYED